MSVINQMLVDLERRRASGEELNRIPDHVRVLPGELQAARLSTSRVVALAVVALFAAGAWWWFSTRPVAVPPAPAAVVVLPAPPERQQEAVELIARRLSLELAEVPADAAPVTPAAAERDAAPAIATALIIPSRSATVTPPEPSRPAPAPERKKSAVVEQVARADIEKQVRQPTPRQRAEAEYAKGATALHQGQPGDARTAFETALQIDPTYHGARQALIGVLLDARRQAEAVEVLQEGLRLAPAQFGFAMTLARLQVERNELDAAAQTLQRSLDYPGVSPDYIAFYAGLLQRQQKHAEAVAQFQRALSQRDNIGVWLLGMGVSLEALGRGADAQEAYRRAKASGNLSAELQGIVDQRLR